MREEIDEKKGIANSLNNIAGVYLLQGDVNKALEYCLDNHIYSASDFESVAEKYNHELTGNDNTETAIEIKTLPNSRNNAKELEPGTSKILDYESIMPN